jgi:hypothetical protein
LAKRVRGGAIDQLRLIESHLKREMAPENVEGGSHVSEEDLKLLLKLRRRAQLLRLQVQEKRVLVESKREAQCDADEQYIKNIRMHHALNEQPGQMDPSEVAALEILWSLCQTAHKEYGSAADSLTDMEYRLEAEEARLERTETRFCGHLDIPQPAPLLTSLLRDPGRDISQDGDHDKSSSKSTQESQPTSQVGYSDYLWRLGNLDLAQERYQALINEKSMLEEEQTKRQRLGLDLDEEDSEFLMHFEETLEPVKKELDEVSEDVQRLKQLCIEKGLMDVHGKPTLSSVFDGASTSESRE